MIFYYIKIQEIAHQLTCQAISFDEYITQNQY